MERQLTRTDLVVLTEHNGSTTCGPTILVQTLGLSLIALDTFQHPGKAMLQLW